MKIAYIFVISDLFHYGHLQLLIAAKEQADKLICGVMTDDAVLKTGSPPISNYHERSSVIGALKYVDEILPQHSQDPYDNLCLLREKYPNDEIIFVYGENWGEVFGGSSLNKMNITLKQQSFYKKLSNNHIACKFVEKYYPNLGSLDTFTERFVIEDFDRFSRDKVKFTVTTKANTLQKLKPLLKKSFIEKTYVFTVADWNSFSEEVLTDIKEKFGQDSVVVRSSCLNEDTMTESKAGHYQSFLNINPHENDSLKRAISQVILSYSQENVNLSDQILVQHHTKDVFVSGVLFTRDLSTNAPYFIINYDIGDKTDTVTSGKNGYLLKIFKHTHRRILENHWQQLLEAVDEIEHIIPDIPLDIEFAIKNNRDVVIFQVRPLSATVKHSPLDEDQIEAILKQQSQRYHHNTLENQDVLQGFPLVYSDMAFWNPSELIGCQPSILAYDMFNILFMQKAWQNGLSAIGYHQLKPKGLMERFCNKPYINVNIAFLSLIPKSISEKYHHPLNAFYLKKLEKNPHLHDKVEFQILFTCYDFTLEKRLAELLSYGFTIEATNEIYNSLLDFSKDLIANSNLHFEDAKRKLVALEENQNNILNKLQHQNGNHESLLEQLLSTCEELGTTPFATIARMAFVAESLLKSLVESDAILLQEYHEIKQSFCTVAYELTKAASDVAKGIISKDEFMCIYGHLRPGTYDITQKRYDQSEQMVFDVIAEEHKSELSLSLINKINTLLLRSPLQIDFDSFYSFVKQATELREYVKLIFTKVISNILEQIKEIGARYDILAESLAFLEIKDILNLKKIGSKVESLISQRKDIYNLYKKIPLPALVTRQEDFMLISSFQARPNFVTDSSVESEILILDERSSAQQLNDKIIFIESADPGFHWILAHPIKGVITKYGGAASHMAICCAELSIPAAIGCGDTYDELKKAYVVKLDCVNELIERIR